MNRQLCVTIRGTRYIKGTEEERVPLNGPVPGQDTQSHLDPTDNALTKTPDTKHLMITIHGSEYIREISVVGCLTNKYLKGDYRDGGEGGLPLFSHQTKGQRSWVHSEGNDQYPRWDDGTTPVESSFFPQKKVYGRTSKDTKVFYLTR